MPYAAESYVHEMDRRAFAVLDTFPHFVKMVETYQANVDEKAQKIRLLSTSVRLGRNQMPEVYNLLPPICEKLGIDVPELYFVQKRESNAVTIGTTNPCISVTAGLVRNLSPELLSSVLAHECGHIALRHCLYHSVAELVVGGVSDGALGYADVIRHLVTPGLVSALRFWDRCSELSADRAAALCDGKPDEMVDALLKINGYANINREEFIRQAVDLRSFVDEAKINQVLEQLMVNGETHPRLATRVYECCEWAKTDSFKSILNGTYKQTPKCDTVCREEIVEAGVEFKAERKDMGTSPRTERALSAMGVESQPSDKKLDEALAQVNLRLEQYAFDGDRTDYALGIISGLFAGVIDAVYVGEVSFDASSIKLSHKQVNKFIQEYAKSRGLHGEHLKDDIGALEREFKVAQDNIWKGSGIGVAAKNHHLADLAHHPTPLGLLSSIVVQFLRVGTFVNKDGEWHFLPVKTGAKDIVQALAPTVITGALNWLVTLGEKKYQEKNGEEIPKALRGIARFAASAPMLAEIARCADNWFGHLVSDMGGSKNTAGEGMGIPGIFISLFYELASLPVLKDSGLPKVLNDLYQNHKVDLRHEIGLYKELGRQSIPVIFNEIFTRVLFFVSRLGRQISKHPDLKSIDWKATLPFHNRTLDRMLMVSSMTFTLADTADAAVHAAIECGGEWIVFAGRFVRRFNYVGAGRAVIAVVREVSNEAREAQLIHEKLILTEAKTADITQRFSAYRAALEERLSDYLAEDMKAFLAGFDDMNRGFETGDSDLVIRGNVTIQRVLGREPQFTTQREFDALMDSDDALIL